MTTTRERASRGRPTTLPSPWRELADALGGVAALADACKVRPSTVWRWAAGVTTPGGVVQDHVRALARQHKVAAPW